MTPRQRLIGLAIIEGLLVLSAWSSAHGTTNLALVCPQLLAAGGDGKSVSDACGGESQTGQILQTPANGDLVRVNPAQRDWGDPGYKFKLWENVAEGEFYQVCASDFPQGTPIPGAQCSSWPFIQRPARVASCATIGSNPIKTSWTPPTQNTDGSAVDTPISYKLYVDDAVKVTTFETAYNFNAATGPHFIYVTAVTVKGESGPSGTGCKTIRIGAPSNGKIERPGNGSIVPK